MKLISLLLICTVAHCSSFSGGAVLPPAITTAHFDNTKGNWNAQERILTPAVVSGAHFGVVGSVTVAGFIFSQPVYVPKVTINGKNKDLIIVATLAGNITAFDANNLGTAVWTHNFGSLHAGIFNTLYSQPYGCMSSPAVDPVLQKVYVVCGTAGPNWVLNVVSLIDGSVLNAVTLAASVVGTGDPMGGDPTSGPNLLFFPQQVFGRSSVTLANGKIYLCFASTGDTSRPYHGWVMVYAQSNLAQLGAWCATPNAYGGAVWMSGGGAAIDAAGNVYVSTGNGTYDGVTAYSDSVVKLDGTTLAVLDWFTPSNFATLESNDWDVSSNRAYLLPNSQVLVAGKANQVYVMGTGCMGHTQGSSGCALQAFPTSGSGSASSFIGTYGGAFGLGHVYLPTLGGPTYSFAYNSSTGLFNTTPTHTTPNVPYPGSQMSLSSNGLNNGILWTVGPQSNAGTTSVAGTLVAWDPVTLTALYTNTTYGSYSKFTSPLVANGRVYLTTNDGTIIVLGMN